MRRWLITPLIAAIFAGFYIHTRLAAAKNVFRVGRWWARRQMIVSGVRVRTIGNVPGPGPFVFVSNHQSLVDTPIMMGWLGAEFRFIAKDTLFKVPIIGMHLKRGGHLAVTREDARGALETLAAAERIIREQHTSILVFAEGTRSAEGLQEFKSGAAHLAIQAGVPVVPVALSGTAALLLRGEWATRAGNVTLAIGAPIPTTGLTRRDRDALTLQIRNSVNEMLARSA